MLFEFRNIGIVDTADIEVKGLTVITGLNDIGKSFLSKSIYSVIKTNREAVEQSRLVRFQQLQAYFTAMQGLERVSLTKSPLATIRGEQDITATPINSSELFNRLNIAIQLPLRGLDDVEAQLLEYKEKILLNFSQNKNTSLQVSLAQNKKQLEDMYNRIIGLLSTTNQPEKDNVSFFNKVIIQQLFKGQINSLKNPEATGEIVVKHEGDEILHLRIVNNVSDSFVTSELGNFYEDAILIESPVVLQMVSFILSGLAFGNSILPQVNLAQPRIAGLPYHYYDLVYKIINNAGISSSEFITVINAVQGIIGGKLYYDPVSRSITFDKENQGGVKDNNIASGIKSLGTLGLLLVENVINKKSLLIIDEPEVHLHPKWEIEYAKIIVALCGAGIPIVISSHSPYLIRAIQEYGSEIRDKTKFYFGVKENGVSKFKDVSDDLNPIYSALADPMKSLFNIS